MRNIMRIPCTYWHYRQHLRDLLQRSMVAILKPCRTNNVLDALKAAYNTRKSFPYCHEIISIDNLGNLLAADDFFEEPSAANPYVVLIKIAALLYLGRMNRVLTSWNVTGVGVLLISIVVAGLNKAGSV